MKHTPVFIGDQMLISEGLLNETVRQAQSDAFAAGAEMMKAKAAEVADKSAGNNSACRNIKAIQIANPYKPEQERADG